MKESEFYGSMPLLLNVCFHAFSKEIKKQVDFVNSKREEKIELNYKTQSDWMKECQNITYTSRAKIKKIQ